MNYNKTPVVTYDFNKNDYVAEKQVEHITSGGSGEAPHSQD